MRGVDYGRAVEVYAGHAGRDGAGLVGDYAEGHGVGGGEGGEDLEGAPEVEGGVAVEDELGSGGLVGHV